MASRLLYQHQDTAMLRIPLAPELPRRAKATAPEVDEWSAPQLVRYLREAAADPVFLEAVEVASTSLGQVLERVGDGDQVRLADLRRAALSIARYRSRTRARPTPFGLFAGVTLATFDTATKVELGAGHERGVRADRGWLQPLVSRWEQDPEILVHLDVVRNDLCYVRGDRLVLPYITRRSEEDLKAAQEMSVRMTGPVAELYELTASPRCVADLRDRLQEAYPGAAATPILDLIVGLVRTDALLTELRPPLTATDPIGHVRARLAQLPAGPTIARAIGELDDVTALLDAYVATPLGAGVPALRAAGERMRQLHAIDRPIQVDLRSDADVRLPLAVAEEAARAVTTMWHLSTPEIVPPSLAQMRELFQERYGNDLVPLNELLDPERGLDAPAGYVLPAPRRNRHLPAYANIDPPQRTALLAALAADAIRSGAVETVLSDDDVAKLTRPTSAALAPTAEMCVQLLAASVDALDRGEFRLVVTATGGTWQAGAFFGRFAYLFADGTERISDLAAAGGVESVDQVQLDFQPSDARSGNVSQVPAILPGQLHVGTYPHSAAHTPVRSGDVLIGVDDHGLYAVHAATGRELDVTVPHMLNMRLAAPNAARLLCDISRYRSRGWEVWQWGALESLPFLPQIRHGRTILAPALWRPSADLLDPAVDFTAWRKAFHLWRERWTVPPAVQARSGDHFITLDLDDAMDLRVLHDELRRRPATELTATAYDAAGAAGTTWLDGYASEIVIPLRATRDVHPVPDRPATTARPAARMAHAPGGDWLYAKLYASAELHDTLLAHHVDELVSGCGAGVDRWFYIRYCDPEPHLRIRLHVDSGVPGGAAQRRLHDWSMSLIEAGLARDLTIATYVPELHRYGGPEAIEAAERVFHADSAAAIVGLTTAAQRSHGLGGPLLMALSMLHLAQAFDPPRWQEWLLASYPKERAREAFRGCRAEALRLADLSGAWTELVAAPGGADLYAAWQRRTGALGELLPVLAATNPTDPDGTARAVLGSLLHMAHNRQVGVDRDAENAAYAILRGVVEVHHNRRRFGS